MFIFLIEPYLGNVDYLSAAKISLNIPLPYAPLLRPADGTGIAHAPFASLSADCWWLSRKHTILLIPLDPLSYWHGRYEKNPDLARFALDIVRLLNEKEVPILDSSPMSYLVDMTIYIGNLGDELGA